MNPLWALFFKDRLRTPFSVYKMSVAEVAFSVAVVFGVGYGIGEGIQWFIDLNTNSTSAIEVSK